MTHSPAQLTVVMYHYVRPIAGSDLKSNDWRTA